MASILDEYEDSLSRSAVLQPGCPSVGIPHSGYVNAQLEKEVPIFAKHRIDFTPSERITSLVVSSNQLCMSLGKDTLLRGVLLKITQCKKHKVDSKHKLGCLSSCQTMQTTCKINLAKDKIFSESAVTELLTQNQ
uniref:Pep3/Vps18 beta-propeller domain-containing protein n=1 Tax=Prolemur simus TaxID=1328070 RepID=A0A8C9ALQ7_PROSS